MSISLPNQANIITLEALAQPERAELNRQISTSSTSGVIIGGLRRRLTKKLAPLLLKEGNLYLLLANSIASVTREPFEHFIEALEREGNRSHFFTIGQNSNDWWILRRFFPKVIEGFEVLRRDPSQRLTLVMRVVQEVQAMHLRGVIHGHLTPSNVAIDEDEIFILDHRQATFAAETKADTSIAPELLKGEIPHEASDVFGLGLVVRKILGEDPRGDISRLLAWMGTHEPEDRPSLAQVSAELHALLARANAGSSAGLTPLRDAQKAIALNPSQKPAVGGITVASKYRPVILIGGVILLAAFLLQRNFSLSARSGEPVESNDIKPRAPYANYWSGKDPNQIAEVATAAVRGDEEARQVILRDLRSTPERQGIRLTLLHVAFSPEWRADLSHADQDVAMRIALASLVQAPLNDLPPFSALHPGIALAVAADLAPSGDIAALNTVAAQALAKLPPPYGPAFVQFNVLHPNSTMGEASARALAHMLVGDSSDEVLNALFGKGNASSLEQTVGHLLIVLPFIDRTEHLAERIEHTLLDREDELAERILWFRSEKNASWGKISASQRLTIATGIAPQKSLPLEYYADLISFPVTSVRVEAARRLRSKDFPFLDDALTVLVGKENHLSRDQNVSLILALRATGDRAYPFISAWFSTHPDAATVVSLLAHHQSGDVLDPFSVEAARYLKNEPWTPTVEQIKKLVANPEPLVRAVVYAKVDADKPEGRRILEQMAPLEPSPRLRKEIEERLHPGVHEETE